MWAMEVVQSFNITSLSKGVSIRVRNIRNPGRTPTIAMPRYALQALVQQEGNIVQKSCELE